MSYVAIINVPGYLLMDDDPPIFDTAAEAWEYLAGERELAEDEAGITTDITVTPTEDLGYSETVWKLRGLSAFDGITATGTVYGPTPGYDGDHDLGVAYGVGFVEDCVAYDIELVED